MDRISLVKLLADYIFCTIDVLHLGERWSVPQTADGLQAGSGLVAALLGTLKLYLKAMRK
jgi:hypothetical protein